MREFFVNRLFLFLALIIACTFVAPIAPGALIDSQVATSNNSARKILVDYYETLGLATNQAAQRVNALQDHEVRTAVLNLEQSAIGTGEENEESPLRVGLTILVVVAAITGIYLFANN